MGNIHVKIYEIWTSGSGGDVCSKKKFMDEGCTPDAGQRPITILYIEPSAHVS